jgi:Secretion system C-terminal sorting domain
MIKNIGSLHRTIHTSIIVLCLFLSVKNVHAQYFKTRFSFNQSTNELSFYIKPTVGFVSTDIGSFQFDITYPLGSTINFGAVTNNTIAFPGLNVMATNLFTLNSEWVKRWEHQGFIPFQTYNLNTEYLVFSVVVSGNGPFTLNYKSDYPNFDPVFTVNSDDGTPLWDNTAPYDVYYPTQLQSGNIVYMTLGITLPVELSNFSTQISDNSVFLSWSTNSEHNLIGFEIERSSDGKIFNNIGFEKNRGGSILTNYNYEDKDLISGTDHYYRLKILNQDGTYEYSNIKFVSMPDTEYSMEIMPNPAGTTFQIRLNMETSEILYLEMYDVQGRIIAQKKSDILEGNSIWEIETEGIQNGNYLLRLISSQHIISKKISIVK